LNGVEGKSGLIYGIGLELQDLYIGLLSSSACISRVATAIHAETLE
jgi:hypothetical protein